MPSKDLHNNIYPKRGLSPVAAVTNLNTPFVSQIVDTMGFESVEWITLIGANTDADATFVTLFEDGDASNLSDSAAVADGFLLGTEALAGFQFDDDNEVRKIGYVGPKRYCRVTITPSGSGAGDIFIAGCWILGHAHDKPTANPPA
ncbi:hypothetical protein [Mesorhizobium sp. M0496]|uniref:hypothetical protein n=1 Tax=Mesorhizobium sp. M0496 TaxID=2956952 RepID=UPI003335E436